MKRAWWFLACLAVLSISIVAVPSPEEKPRHYPMAEASLSTLAGLPGVEPLGQSMACGTRIRYSVKNYLMAFVGMDPHEDPIHIRGHRFRNAAGIFSVQLVEETGGQISEVTICGDPSSGLPPETMAILKPLFPDADYYPTP